MTKANFAIKTEDKPSTKVHAELSENALDQASGGSFSWSEQTSQLCDGSVRTGVASPSLLLPAVKPAI